MAPGAGVVATGAGPADNDRDAGSCSITGGNTVGFITGTGAGESVGGNTGMTTSISL